MPLAPDAPFVPRSVVWVHRDLPDEVRVPFKVTVLHHDERIVVVDKPPFLATMPRGRHIRQTVLARLRVELGLPRLAPAHRLDRLTSGCSSSPPNDGGGVPISRCSPRAARTRTTSPVRRCPRGGALPSGVVLPATVEVHLSKPHGQLQSHVLADRIPNSRTDIDLIGRDEEAGVGSTTCAHTPGRTPPTCAHLAWLGIPICGDPLYPEIRDVNPDDFQTPLGLVARRLRFRDPVDGTPRAFESDRVPWPWSGAAPTLAVAPVIDGSIPEVASPSGETKE
ncbi:MAG: pseudouridine synthase [Actinomycetales bacterium]|uniref:Pseudouridine synthase n=1 Tax=Candidatus Phosphoribacter hodrii TaxID=2953743 RepID=A0A9D7T9Y5_9MICO|nr:pseudouridine synthase [Candidatus Phosphoribacter hodrii]